jgi:hypothetical protein
MSMPLVMMDVIGVILVVVLWFLFASKFKALGNFVVNKILKPFKEEDKDIEEKIEK